MGKKMKLPLPLRALILFTLINNVASASELLGAGLPLDNAGDAYDQNIIKDVSSSSRCEFQCTTEVTYPNQNAPFRGYSYNSGTWRCFCWSGGNSSIDSVDNSLAIIYGDVYCHAAGKCDGSEEEPSDGGASSDAGEVPGTSEGQQGVDSSGVGLFLTCGGRCPVDTDVGAELCTSFLYESDREPHCNAGCIPDSEFSFCQLICGDDSVANNVGAADSSVGISTTTITAEQKKRDMLDDLLCGECKFFECCVSDEATSDTKYETCKGLSPLGEFDISGDPSCGEKCDSTDIDGELCTSFMEAMDIKPHCDAGCIPESDLLACDLLCSDYVAAPVAAAPDTVIPAPQKKRDVWEDVVCGECRYYQCCVSDEETCEEPDIESLLPDIDSLFEDFESLFPDDWEDGMPDLDSTFEDFSDFDSLFPDDWEDGMPDLPDFSPNDWDDVVAIQVPSETEDSSGLSILGLVVDSFDCADSCLNKTLCDIIILDEPDFFDIEDGCNSGCLPTAVSCELFCNEDAPTLPEMEYACGFCKFLECCGEDTGDEAKFGTCHGYFPDLENTFSPDWTPEWEYTDNSSGNGASLSGTDSASALSLLGQLVDSFDCPGMCTNKTLCDIIRTGEPDLLDIEEGCNSGCLPTVSSCETVCGNLDGPEFMGDVVDKVCEACMFFECCGGDQVIGEVKSDACNMPDMGSLFLFDWGPAQELTGWSDGSLPQGISDAIDEITDAFENTTDVFDDISDAIENITDQIIDQIDSITGDASGNPTSSPIEVSPAEPNAGVSGSPTGAPAGALPQDPPLVDPTVPVDSTPDGSTSPDSNSGSYIYGISMCITLASIATLHLALF